ncbi:hypothetical protein NG799_01910 [Laspinema sp. D1]|uniref:Uncharacterized protein n=2 Tax=Laspinema TaxID=2584823 RepID=A0ABT2MKT0_9CYAN|nr:MULTISPECIES: hypothetical protein [unclassified Laspinema]MCT7965087.1 hypothetical protein [Laspinema sp. D2a]MCT7977626.1 hypothetical protein [Laspinema sp. D3b]MCT7992471.1 hypothetical protein [Laspinema sp. D3c]
MSLGFAEWATGVSNYWKSEYTRQGLFDSTDIEQYQKQGYYVVYDSQEICCPETDATLGYATSILNKPDGSLALFLDYDQAKEFANQNQAFCAKPTGIAKPTGTPKPKPKLRPKDQPKPTDAVLGGRGTQPNATDAVLGNSLTVSRQQLFNQLKTKGGTPEEWSRLAILDRELGYTSPQFPHVTPYRVAWNRSASP